MTHVIQIVLTKFDSPMIVAVIGKYILYTFGATENYIN